MNQRIFTLFYGKRTRALGALLALFLLSSCVSMKTFDENEKTMTTDIEIEKLSRTEYYNQLGENHFEQNHISQAIESFRLALLHDDKNQRARFNLGIAYEKSGQDQLALLEFQKFLADKSNKMTEQDLKILSHFFEKTKSYSKIYEICQNYFNQNRSEFAAWKMYEYSMQQSQFEKAASDLQKIEPLVSESNRHILILAKAEIAAAEKKYDQALIILKDAEKIKPFDEMVLKKKIQYNDFLKNWNEVIAAANKYSKYQKHNVFVSESITKAALKIENYQFAIDELEWQMQFQSRKNMTKLKIAHLNYLLKKFDIAEKQYQELATYPELQDEIKFYLSRIYDQTNRSSLALDTLAAIDDSSVYYADTQVRLATIDYNNRNMSSALNRLRKAHLIKPDSIAIYKLYSDYLIENNSFAEAVALLEKGLLKTTPNEVLHMNLAFCHYKLRNYNMFKKEYQKVMEINPANSRTYEMLAELWYKDDKKSSEIEYFARMAMKLGTENENLMKILAWVYVDQNKLNEAVALFENLYDKNPKDFFYAEMLSKIYHLKNIPSRAQKYADYARVLHDEVNVKDYLNDLFKSRAAGHSNNIYEDQRKPASLE